jgi:hypothetical protein
MNRALHGAPPQVLGLFVEERISDGECHFNHVTLCCQRPILWIASSDSHRSLPDRLSTAANRMARRSGVTTQPVRRRRLDGA